MQMPNNAYFMPAVDTQDLIVSKVVDVAPAYSERPATHPTRRLLQRYSIAKASNGNSTSTPTHVFTAVKMDVINTTSISVAFRKSKGKPLGSTQVSVIGLRGSEAQQANRQQSFPCP